MPIKEIIFALLALGACTLISHLNRRIFGDRFSWTAGRFRPRGSNSFPIVPQHAGQVERRNPRRWLLALLDALVLVLVIIWFLAKTR